MRKQRAARSGFTLIELLVVVGIIALLVAILLPSLARARQQAMSASCKSRLRQLGIGMLMYMNQYDAYPAHQWKLNDPADTRIRWFTAMARQLSGYTVQNCPATPDWRIGRNNSYGYNYKYLGSARTNHVSPKAPWESYPVKHVRATSRTIAFGDADGTGWQKPYQADSKDLDRFGNHGYTLDPTYLPRYCEQTLSGDKPEPYASGKSRTYISTRHLGGSNFCFVDGHVELLRPIDVYTDNRYWNTYGAENPQRDDHIDYKYLDGDWRFDKVPL